MVLLDTNILLLWLVGHVDVFLLLAWKRVDIFDVEDFERLKKLLFRFSAILTTPHVLAEVSNFIDQAPQHRRLALIESLRKFADENREHYEQARNLVQRTEFKLLGLTDTALVDLSADAVVVTMDFHLYNRIVSLGREAINFNHRRYKN
jgi:rRNA-processing protein FCF1